MSPIFYTIVVLSVVGLYLSSLVAYKTSFRGFFDRVIFSSKVLHGSACLTLLAVLGFVLATHTSVAQSLWAGLTFTFAFPHVFHWMVRPAKVSFHSPETIADETRPG